MGELFDYPRLSNDDPDVVSHTKWLDRDKGWQPGSTELLDQARTGNDLTGAQLGRRSRPLAELLRVTALFVLGLSGLMQPTARAETAASPTSPQGVHQAFAAAFNARDLESMLALYEPEAAAVPEPGKVVRGSDNLRAAMEGYLAIPGEIRIETLFVIEAGDIALTRSRWEVRDRGKISASASGTEIMRRRPDGTWDLVVDNPFGGDPAQ